MLWGMFKKVVIADSLAPTVDAIFSNYQNESGVTLILGAVAFSFQIYGDFSGYSDIALGTAKLFGIELLSNFKFPYFSRDIAEFWRRWHISLSSWFRDYLYIPLGGSRNGKLKAVRNTFIIFLVSGFWHGASWNFIAWGFIHACGFLPLLLLNRNRRYTTDIVAQGKTLPSFKELIQMLSTFAFVTVGWVFFRAETIGVALGYLNGIILDLANNPTQVLHLPSINSISDKFFFLILLLILTLIFFDWKIRFDNRKIPQLKYIVYIFMGFWITLGLINGQGAQDFIYFQF
jgi:D-alanyl-lipoteichoic acid acyltransferase DltB (MBOAT superfamily)